MTKVQPFRLNVAEEVIDDLWVRLASARWPDPETVSDWSQGPRLEKMQALCDYWLEHYDWRRCKAKLNAFDSFMAEVDGVGVHFLHARSPVADANPSCWRTAGRDRSWSSLR